MNTIIWTDAQGESRTLTVAKRLGMGATVAALRWVARHGGTVVTLNGMEA